MRLSGRGGEVLGVEMEFIGGDRSVMTITPERGAGGGRTGACRRAPRRDARRRRTRPPPRRAGAGDLAGRCCWPASALIARTHFSADLSAFLPASPDARQRVLIEQLQSGVASRTLLIGIEGGKDAAQRADVSRALGKGDARRAGLFDQVQNGDTSDWKEAGTWVFDHRYQLSPDVTPERFTADGLRDAIVDTLSLLGTPAGNALKPLLERDPTGETQRIAEGLIPASSPRSEEGVWVSRDAPRALLLATTHAAGSDLDAQSPRRSRACRPRSTTATHGHRRRRARSLQMSGAPVFSVQSRDQIKGEAIHLAVVGGIVMGGLLLLAFASPRALVIALLPVATGVVGGTAAVSLVFGDVHGLTMGFGSTLIGETVDYAIYYLIQARGARGAGHRLAALARHQLADRAAGPADVGVRLRGAGVLGLSGAGAAGRVLDRRAGRGGAGRRATCCRCWRPTARPAWACGARWPSVAGVIVRGAAAAALAARWRWASARAGAGGLAGRRTCGAPTSAR